MSFLKIDINLAEIAIGFGFSIAATIIGALVVTAVSIYLRRLRQLSPLRAFWDILEAIKGSPDDILYIVSATLPAIEPTSSRRTFGWGEAMALTQLGRLFSDLGFPEHKTRVEFSDAISNEDLKGRNRILLGGPIHNSHTKELMQRLALRYTFGRPDQAGSEDSPRVI